MVYYQVNFMVFLLLIVKLCSGALKALYTAVI
jgi:hypothetical protein